MRKGQVDAPFQMLITTIMLLSVLFIGMKLMGIASDWMTSRQAVAEINKLVLNMKYVDNSGPGTTKRMTLTIPKALVYVVMFPSTKLCGSCIGYEEGCVKIIALTSGGTAESFCAGISDESLGAITDCSSGTCVGDESSSLYYKNCEAGTGLSKERGVTLTGDELTKIGDAIEFTESEKVKENQLYCFLPGYHYLQITKMKKTDDDLDKVYVIGGKT